MLVFYYLFVPTFTAFLSAHVKKQLISTHKNQLQHA